MTARKPPPPWWVPGALILLALAMLLGVLTARAEGMMGVGTMMSPTNGSGSTPGGGFAILTESSSPLSTEASSVLVTEDHP